MKPPEILKYIKQFGWVFSVLIWFQGSVSSGQNLAGYIYDTDYPTFAAACTAAGSGTLVVTRVWKSLSNSNYGCNLTFPGTGMLQAGNGQTVTLSGTITAGAIQIFDISGGGAILATGAELLYIQWFGVRGDNSTENSTAVQGAVTAAMASAKPLYWPAGIYLGCASTVTNRGPLTIYGAGMRETTYRRHPSCQHDNPATMITVKDAASIEIRDMGFDMVTGGAERFSGAIFAASGSGSFLAERTYWANASAVGIQCQPCQNATVTNSTFYRNWWFGLSFASGGTTTDPIYGYNFNIHGNIFIDTPIGAGLSFFLSNISITGNVFDRSNLSLVQMPHAYATIEGNTFNGVADQGCIVSKQCGGANSYNAIFLEGVSDWTIGSNLISNFNGQQGAMICLATTLQIPEPGGTILKLPCSRASINGLTIVDSNSGYSILIAGSRDDTYGTDISIKNTHVAGGVNQCPIAGGVVGLDMSNNTCNSAANGGYTLNDIHHGSFRGNLCRNCNTAEQGGTRPGLIITGKSTRDLDIIDNLFENDEGNSLSYGIQDSSGVSGQNSQIHYSNNRCGAGCAGGVYSPAPVGPESIPGR